MFNSTAYSQITGLSPYSKKEIVKGLYAGDEYKKIIRGNQQTITEYKILVKELESLVKVKDERLKGKDDVIDGQKLHIGLYLSKLEEYDKANKKLKRANLLLKIGIGAAIVAYGYERIR
jgi:hypothetical protein